ncbi:MAG: DUF6064 family protein [Xanthobacteraceae bacterium]
MSEWWSYTLSDFLMFSPQTYYRLFELYNLAIWPWQLLAIALGLGVLVLWLRGGSWHGRAIAVILAACWLWVAWAYLLVRFDPINWAARYFAAGFAIEAALLLWSGLVRDRLRLQRQDWHAANAGGLALFAFALLAWPLIGLLVGRPLAQAEIFGVAPDPTAVATLGILLGAGRVRWELVIIPSVWCVISAATLWTLRSPDFFLPLAAVVLVVFIKARVAVLAAKNQSSPLAK